MPTLLTPPWPLQLQMHVALLSCLASLVAAESGLLVTPIFAESLPLESLASQSRSEWQERSARLLLRSLTPFFF